MATETISSAMRKAGQQAQRPHRPHNSQSTQRSPPAVVGNLMYVCVLIGEMLLKHLAVRMFHLFA